MSETMVTITMPEWAVWAIIAFFFLQWGMNGVLAYYKNKCAKSYDRLDAILGAFLIRRKPND